MLEHLILSVMSEDRPGIIEAVANTVASHKGSWLESRLCQLGGKFAGVVRIHIDRAELEQLSQALDALGEQNIQINIDQAKDGQVIQKLLNCTEFHATGPDKRGIVKELSRAFSDFGINVLELHTHLSSMPYSGEPMFEAKGQLGLPNTIDLAELREKLDTIADILALDISLKTAGSLQP